MSQQPYDALTIAKWFVAWAEANDADLSNLKLQKLLYYAQGHHFATEGRALFFDTIQAWSHGPVIPNVYHQFKKYGSGDITLEEADPFDWPHVDAQTTQFLIGVWDRYGGIAAWQLRNMTHAEAPWKEHFRGETVRDVEIPQKAIKQYFNTLAEARM